MFVRIDKHIGVGKMDEQFLKSLAEKNLELLFAVWELLIKGHPIAGKFGLDHENAELIKTMTSADIIKLADVELPLFSLKITPQYIAAAIAAPSRTARNALQILVDNK